MATLDIAWLRVFVEIYKTRSVSVAAERLGIAQAAASVALGKLRVHFSDRLFARTAQGMEATPYAQAVYDDVVSSLEKLTRMSAPRAAFAAATAVRTFHIGMTDISEVVILPKVVNHLRQIAPAIQLETETITSASAEQLASGHVDLAIGFMPQLEAGFHQQVLFSQDFVCLISQDHPRLRSSPGKRDFLAEGHVVVTSSGTGHAIVDKVLAQRGLVRRVVVKTPSFLGIARMVAQTELVAIVPRRLGEAFAAQERVRLLEPPVPLPTYAVKQHWHERFHAEAGNAWLRRTVAELFRD